MSDFLKKMLEIGKRHAGGGGAGIVGRIKIEAGLHRYVSGHDFWSFWKPVADVSDKEIDRVKAELRGRMQKAGSNDSPNFGLKITIDKNVLSRDQPYKADLQEFIPSWQEDAYGMVVEHIEQGSLPLGEWFYGHVQYKANPYSVKKGEAGKTDTDQEGNPRFPTIRVPVEKYADEAAARAAVGGSGSTGQSGSEWSARALQNYHNINDLEGLSDEINGWYEKAKNGIAFNDDEKSYPLPDPLTPPTAKKYIADIYDIEPSDVDLLIPF